MSEQTTATQEATTTEQQNVLPNPFDESSWQTNQEPAPANTVVPAPPIVTGKLLL